MIPRLPHDVHVEIINWVFRGSQYAHVDSRTLCACSLVCKFWTGPSQRLLFWHTHLTGSEKRIELLVAAMRGNALLGTYIRSISVIYSPGSIMNDFFLAFLTLTPSVSSLFVIFAGIMPTDGNPSTVEDLLEGLHRLKLRITSFIMLGGAGLVPHFTSLWPDLQSLQLEHPVEKVARFSTPAGLKIRCNGQPLWILDGSVDVSALRELEVAHVNWNETASRFTHTTAFGGLTALIVDRELPPQAVLDRCLQLRTLVFASNPIVAVALPATLRHVGYHASTESSETGVLTVDVRHLLRALRSLPALCLVTTTRALCPATEAQIMLECEDMHVEFATYLTADRFRGAMAIDWI
ncbi:hypothetical protein FA95DRAFT_116486 [Auriscalpium vulgare]|uniref:Uncharacterized protein n=1 Tax=Auriscalpium vulgare TaxID=40419 RepID=A0ACB8RNJ1_9AGAM|nr:hypothetical protein FA95DRAFT_116486 [Auriscalpium vulgare]